MRCEDVRGRLLTYLDADLPDREVAELDAHLAGCADCRAQLREERDFSEQLAPPSGLVGADFAAAVMKRVVALPPPALESASVVRLHPWARPLAPLLAVAAALVAWLTFPLGSGELGNGEHADATARALAAVGSAVVEQAGDLWAVARSLGHVAEASYQAALGFTSELTSFSDVGLFGDLPPGDVSLALHAVTAIAALACALLIARFRSTASEESRP